MAVPPGRRKARLPLKLSELISPYPVPPFRLCPHVPALGTHSGMPGTPCCCCLSCRLRYSNSSLMSLHCPVLVQGDVLPSHPASLLPQAIFRTLPPKSFSRAKEEPKATLWKSMVETRLLQVLHGSIFFGRFLPPPKLPGFKSQAIKTSWVGRHIC